MKVRNVNRDPGNCKCDSWIEHWDEFNYAGQKRPPECPVIACSRPVTDGAHVNKLAFQDRNLYIIPLCHLCNTQFGKVLEIDDDIAFASANISETCGK